MDTKTAANGLLKRFTDDNSAREFLEAVLWPDGPICPHCGVVNEAYRLGSKPDSKNKIRPGLWKCKDCRKTFTVTVGTIFEDSHIPLSKWFLAIHLLCASKKGMSAHQLHRMLGVTYKTAWFMAHRIRSMMDSEPSGKLFGTVEVDETYVGGKKKGTPRGRPGVGSHKAPVVSLVQREGTVRSFHMERVTGDNLKQVLKQNVEPETNLMTDDFSAYDPVQKQFPNRDVITHSKGEYSRREGGKSIHTNTVEGFFSILKRGIIGVYHHVGKQHLHRYLNEFDFRYNSRRGTDTERTLLAIKGAEGKRLMYRDSCAKGLSHALGS